MRCPDPDALVMLAWLEGDSPDMVPDALFTETHGQVLRFGRLVLLAMGDGTRKAAKLASDAEAVDYFTATVRGLVDG